MNVLRAGIDIGGTFTDLVLWDEAAGKVHVHKLPSTPDDPSRAGLEGLSQLLKRAGYEPKDLDFLSHGTTVATNILLERNGARVGMLTTRGFRDILHIGRTNRPFNFSHAQTITRQTDPIVRRRHRLPVAERIAAPDGRVETPLAEEEVRAAVRKLKADGVDAVAVCCLMSFLNPKHEARIKAILEEEFPEAYLSVSHEVTPLYREYERFSTTALNAYVGPTTARYLARFSQSLDQAGVSSGLNLMSSAGGMIPAGEAAQHPVSLLLSGPVGALILGIQAGRQAGHESVITLDVGGTSADIGVAPGGELRMKHLLDTKVGEFDAMIPMVDIATIGAGGGSIAYLDEGGMFCVGPRSAGARPGPACYGFGGAEPTVTDAMVTLGWFRSEALADSGLTISPTLAAQVIQTHIAQPLDMDLLSAAAGIYRIAINNMVEAIRVNSVSKGYDPRDFALVAEGGAGGAFAVQAAAELSIPKVIVPANPGVGAAAGLLAADTKFEFRATVWEDLDQPDLARIEQAYSELETKARSRLDDSGFAPGDTALRFSAECRYAGQGYELSVDVPAPPLGQNWTERVIEAFHEAHETAYLRRFEDKPVMLINVGLAALGHVVPLRQMEIAVGTEQLPETAVVQTNDVHFVEGNRAVPFNTRFVQRSELKANNVVRGPAVIEQSDSTTVVPPAAVARVDTYGSLVITFAEACDD